jgi:hypothetical protein
MSWVRAATIRVRASRVPGGVGVSLPFDLQDFPAETEAGQIRGRECVLAKSYHKASIHKHCFRPLQIFLRDQKPAQRLFEFVIDIKGALNISVIGVIQADDVEGRVQGMPLNLG